MAISVTDTMRLDWLADPQTDNRLLPTMMQNRDNTRRIHHYKSALRWGMKKLKPVQREQLRLFYANGFSKSEIARLQNLTSSAVSKSIRAGEDKLRGYVELYMSIYDRLEQEFMRDEM